MQFKNTKLHTQAIKNIYKEYKKGNTFSQHNHQYLLYIHVTSHKFHTHQFIPKHNILQHNPPILTIWYKTQYSNYITFLNKTGITDTQFCL